MIRFKREILKLNKEIKVLKALKVVVDKKASNYAVKVHRERIQKITELLSTYVGVNIKKVNGNEYLKVFLEHPEYPKTGKEAFNLNIDQAYNFKENRYEAFKIKVNYYTGGAFDPKSNEFEAKRLFALGNVTQAIAEGKLDDIITIHNNFNKFARKHPAVNRANEYENQIRLKENEIDALKANHIFTQGTKIKTVNNSYVNLHNDQYYQVESITVFGLKGNSSVILDIRYKNSNSVSRIAKRKSSVAYDLNELLNYELQAEEVA
jgi:hypothetical protein